jgi:hypothetical protein
VDTSAATYTYDALGRGAISVIGSNTFYSGYDLGSRLASQLAPKMGTP